MEENVSLALATSAGRCKDAETTRETRSRNCFKNQNTLSLFINLTIQRCSLSLSLYTNEIEPKLPKEEEEDEEDEEDGHARCFQSTRERFHSRHCITYLMIVLIALDDGHEKRCDKESLGYCNDRER